MCANEVRPRGAPTRCGHEVRRRVGVPPVSALKTVVQLVSTLKPLQGPLVLQKGPSPFFQQTALGGDLEKHYHFQKREMRCALNKKHGKSCFLFENVFVDFERGHESVGGDFQKRKCVESFSPEERDPVPPPLLCEQSTSTQTVLIFRAAGL